MRIRVELVMGGTSGGAASDDGFKILSLTAGLALGDLKIGGASL